MNEKNLLFALSDPFTEEKINLENIVNAEELFGLVVLNKMVGVVYDNIELNTLHGELRKALTILREDYLNKSELFKQQLKYLSTILDGYDKDYSLLKGSFLTSNIYKSGHRVSNDFDILMNSSNISSLQKLLISNGFVQGYVKKSNEIQEATRREIIDSKMNFGETVPFVKIVENKPMVIDLNFSLDYKAAEDNNLINEMLSNTIFATFENIKFRVLNPIDFIIHLSCHLYKEATTYDWVIRRRDLMLYKFCDINVFMHKYGTQEFFSLLANYIKQYNLQKECYYTFENASIIYPRLNKLEGYQSLKDLIRPNDLSFMKQIIYPRKKLLYQYDMSFTDWFFCYNRVDHLRVISNG